jgi:hypothetical protein
MGREVSQALARLLIEFVGNGLNLRDALVCAKAWHPDTLDCKRRVKFPNTQYSKRARGLPFAADGTEFRTVFVS